MVALNPPASSAPAGLLEQLAPAHAPAPSSAWPLAAGWWLLIALLLGAAAAAIQWQRRPHRRLRALALRELNQIEQQGSDDVNLGVAIENLLRRYAVARYGRERVARLSGESWIAFVAARGGSALAGDSGQQLLRAAYGARAQAGHAAAREHWLSGARGFIRSRA